MRTWRDHRHDQQLALRWRDVDLDAGTVSIRRSAGMVRVAGESAEVTGGDTKSGKPRVVDLDPPTVAVLRSHRKARGGMALQLARDDALVFADHEARPCSRSTSPGRSPMRCAGARSSWPLRRRPPSGCTTCATRTRPSC